MRAVQAAAASSRMRSRRPASLAAGRSGLRPVGYASPAMRGGCSGAWDPAARSRSRIGAPARELRAHEQLALPPVAGSRTGRALLSARRADGARHDGRLLVIDAGAAGRPRRLAPAGRRERHYGVRAKARPGRSWPLRSAARRGRRIRRAARSPPSCSARTQIMAGGGAYLPDEPGPDRPVKEATAEPPRGKDRPATGSRRRRVWPPAVRPRFRRRRAARRRDRRLPAGAPPGRRPGGGLPRRLRGEPDRARAGPAAALSRAGGPGETPTTVAAGGYVDGPGISPASPSPGRRPAPSPSSSLRRSQSPDPLPARDDDPARSPHGHRRRR